jgi:hypothetical protein
MMKDFEIVLRTIILQFILALLDGVQARVGGLGAQGSASCREADLECGMTSMGGRTSALGLMGVGLGLE